MGMQLIISLLAVSLLGILGTPLQPMEIELPKLVLPDYEVPKEQVEIAQNFIQDLIEASNERVILYSEQGNANAYVDKLIASLKNYLALNFNPLEVHNLGEIHWLKAWGLNTVRRTGQSTMTHQGAGFILDINIGFGNIHAQAYFEKQLWWVFWISGTVVADFYDTKVFGRLRVSLQEGVKPRLEDFRITDWGNVQANIINGNWIGTIVSWFPWAVVNFLKENVPGHIRNAIDNVLANVDIQLPIGYVGQA